MGRWASNIVFVLLLVTGLALAVLGALVASGHYVQEPGTGASPKPSTPAAPTSRPAPPAPAKRVVSTTVVITIKASRGDCWVDARQGSSTGKQLAYELLKQDRSITLRGPRVWLRLGAAANVDINVNGHARPVPTASTGFLLG
jgi:hypothetical protein